MTVQSDMALMAAGSYWDVRIPNPANNSNNQAPIPAGWKVLTQYDRKDSGPNAVTGFSARVYQEVSSGKIVISYAGTEFNTSSVGLAADFLSGNVPLAIGKYGAQALEAAKLYQLVKADPALSDNISFTGHSLGGGLASLMAVWFARPAHVFAAAPFQASADFTQVTLLAFSQPALYQVKALLAMLGPVDPAFNSYNPLTDFASREASVTAYAIKGELLEANLGFLNWIEGSTNPLFTNSAITLSAGDKHSIDLHAAALVTPTFETAASALPTALERLMDKKLYGGDVLANSQVIITKLIRNEVGVRDDSGTAVLLTPNGMLTKFSEDLQKLGTNIAGLNKAAQDAIIAQGIEWYYWQGTNYAGQNFFINNATYPNLLQYTSAVGAALPGAMDKAGLYIQKWLSEVYVAHGGAAGTTFPPFGTLFDQWSVVTSATPVTVTARDNNKNQIYIGQAGADTFTASNSGDVIMAGGGNDSITGGTGGDRLYGGQGNDEYLFGGAFGNDIIQDSDATGLIKVDGTTLNGGKKVDDNVWESTDGVYRYQLFSHGATSDLVIGRGSKAICRNPRSTNIKMHSILCKFHESRGQVRFSNRLKRQQYTRNRYLTVCPVAGFPGTHKSHFADLAASI